MEARKGASNLSNVDGERIKSPPQMMVMKNLGADNGAEGKRSAGDERGRSDSLGALDDANGSEGQRASTL